MVGILPCEREHLPFPVCAASTAGTTCFGRKEQYARVHSLLCEQCLQVAIALLSQAMTGDPVEYCVLLHIGSITKPCNSIETPNTRRGAITNEAGSRKLVAAR